LKFKEKLKELFPDIKIFNTQALQRFASMTSSSLPKTTNQAPFPPRSSSQGTNAPSPAVPPSILKLDEADLKAELEEVIRTARPNVSNLPLYYSNRFKKKLSAQHPEVKLKDKLRQLFPGIEFAGEKILLPSLGPPPRNKISTSTNLPPSKIPSPAPVVHSSVSSPRLPPPASSSLFLFRATQDCQIKGPDNRCHRAKGKNNSYDRWIPNPNHPFRPGERKWRDEEGFRI
jgi:hypothetical protein